MHWTTHVNAVFYIISSCLYMLGSIFLHPYFFGRESIDKTISLTYFFGSVLIILGSLQQLTSEFQCASSYSKSLDKDSGVSLCRHTLGSVSGFLLAIASIAFWPTFGTSGQLVGNWNFRCGTSLGAISTLWLLFQLKVKSTRFTLTKLSSVLSLFGSIGFVVGGGFLLGGNKYFNEGSISCIAGSIGFLFSSVLSYAIKICNIVERS